MLDVLRKHASSWLIKVILGAIIISFAFFFGYNRMSKAKRSLKGLAPGQPVAMVNGSEISDTEFRFFYERALERLRESVKDNAMAGQLQKFAQSMTLNQLIQRQLLLQTAASLGIRVTDQELANIIRKNPELIKDGQFDPIFYRHQYLPYFENRFGINYEELVRQDLTIQTLESLFQNVDGETAAQTPDLWTFEVVSIAPKKMVDAKFVKDEGEARSLAESFLSSKDWKGLAQKTHAMISTVGPITIVERSKVLSGRGNFEDYSKIFMLSSARPVLEKPIEVGDSIYIVRFVEKKRSPVAGAPKQSGDFLSDWMREQMKTAKIATYLENE
jgi:hypothetical protein